MARRDSLRRTRRPVGTVMGRAVAPVAPVVTRPDVGRYREIDGHRGVAALAIVVFHVYQFSNVDRFLYLGTPAYTVLNSLDGLVAWFFVISGFVLFEPIARGVVDGSPSLSPRRFLTRRAVRLLPAYYVAVSVVWFSRQQSFPGDWRDLVEHLTFTQVFDGTRIFYTIGPAWSVSVEVIFYLVLVVLSLGLVRSCRRVTDRAARIALLAGAVGGLGAVSAAWKAWSFGVEGRSTTASFTTWFGPMANLDAFAVGMGVAVIAAVLAGRRRMGSRSRWVLRSAGLVVLAVAFTTRRADTWPAVYFSATCAVGFGCVVAAAVLGSREDRWTRVLSSKLLLWFGLISYSLYLWHEPVMLALARLGLIRQAPDAFLRTVPVVLIFSVLVAWFAYRVVERPTHALGRSLRRSDRPLVPPAGAGRDEERPCSGVEGVDGTVGRRGVKS